jgi:ferredoxin
MRGLGYGDGARVRVLPESDPDVVESVLYDLQLTGRLPAQSFAALGGKREVARTALSKLREAAPLDAPDILLLPAGAPYGRIQIDTEGCTLCLACVGACPANALADNAERPQVRFTEAACVQCGLCKVTCPESVITLEARYDFTPAALSPRVLNEQEPFSCIRCGKPFGTKASVERASSRLRGKHWMYVDDEQSRIIQMCDDCRVVTLSESGKDPFAAGERPRIRTTDDYLRAEEQARRTGRNVDDFLN